MKLNFKIRAISFASLFLFSCSSDSPSTNNEPVKDDFSYLSVNFSGKINKIGNNSGKLTPYAQFEGLTSNTINLSTVTSNSEKIFLIEHYPPSDKLFIFDKNTRTTTSKKLIYPSEIVGQEPTLASLTWDDSKKILYGIVLGAPYLGIFKNNSFFVKIDPNTFQVTYSGLNFDQTASISTFFNGSKLYSSYPTTDTFEIDVENNTAKKVLFKNSKFTFSKAAVYNNNTVYCLKDIAGSAGVTITKINLIDYTYEDFLSNESLGNAIQNGSGFIDKSTNEYVCYMVKDGYFSLVKFNISTKEYKHFKLTSDSSIDNNLVIIDKVNN